VESRATLSEPTMGRASFQLDLLLEPRKIRSKQGRDRAIRAGIGG